MDPEEVGSWLRTAAWALGSEGPRDLGASRAPMCGFGCTVAGGLAVCGALRVVLLCVFSSPLQAAAEGSFAVRWFGGWETTVTGCLCLGWGAFMPGVAMRADSGVSLFINNACTNDSSKSDAMCLARQWLLQRSFLTTDCAGYAAAKWATQSAWRKMVAAPPAVSSRSAKVATYVIQSALEERLVCLQTPPQYCQKLMRVALWRPCHCTQRQHARYPG